MIQYKTELNIKYIYLNGGIMQHQSVVIFCKTIEYVTKDHTATHAILFN